MGRRQLSIGNLVCDDARTNEPIGSDGRRNVRECKFRAAIVRRGSVDCT
jgi:hypothetical protein